MERNGEPVSGAGPGGRLLKERGQRLRLGDPPPGDAEREKQHLGGPTGDGDADRLHLQGTTGDVEGERRHPGGPTGDGELRGTRDAEDEAGSGEERAAGELRGRPQRNGVHDNGKGGGELDDRKQNDQEKPRLESPGGQPRQRGDDHAARPTSTGFSRSGAPGGRSLLLDAILSWTVTDVLNDNLYRDEVHNTV